MANEITAKVSLVLNTTNNFSRRFEPPGLQITQNNPGAFENTVSLTTTDAKLSITNLTTYGVGFLQNVSTDSAAVILVGADSTAVIRPFTRLKWREAYPIRLITTTTYRAQMETTSGGRLLYGVWED